ncbi:MAG: sigma factor-like helix-turn-helix DNA-binding protein, partial [Pseudomonadota bacterium]
LQECQALAEENPTLAPSAETICDAVRTLEQIAKALDDLSANARRAFVLRHIDGLTLVETAARLGVSRTMVRRYLVQSLAACYVVIESESE